MKKLIKRMLPAVDFLLPLIVVPSAYILKMVRGAGVQRLPLCRKILLKIGVFPILDHYYEPLFNSCHLVRPLSDERNLPGVEWNEEEQVKLLESFSFGHELYETSDEKKDELSFSFENDAFKSGDAEYWYNLIRWKKPSQIIEIGSGHSTLMAQKAIGRNKEEIPNYECRHICIEPYEQPWLEKADVEVIRERVEVIDKNIFSDLSENDILFIDSSHVIRPQGDVLFEYLELLPSLSRGVIVHIHDIFTPRDYLEGWIKERVRFFNEQYLLEAFLTSNSNWKIIGALNYLHHSHFEKLKDKCPFLARDREPGSFYMQKISS